MSIDKKRELWIDSMKAILILLVIIGHFLLKWIGASGQIPFWCQTIADIIYSFHMPAFIMLSGYIYTHFSSKKIVNEKTFIINKAISLLIPYAIFSLGFGALKIFAAKYTLSPIDISDVLMFPIKPFDYLWFLYTLFSLECLATLFRKVNLLKLLGVSLILYIAYSFILIEFLGIDRLMRYSFFFVIGMLMAEKKGILKILEQKSYIITLSFVLSEFLFIKTISCLRQGGGGIASDLLQNRSYALAYFMSAILGSLTILVLSRKYLDIPTYNRSWLYALGKYSIVFYLIHQPIISMLRVVLIKTGLTAGIYQLTIMLIGTLLISAFVCRLLKYCSILDFIFYPNKYVKWHD